MEVEFSRQILRKILVSNFMKIRPGRAELFHADGRTDMTKLRVIFRNCANALKNARNFTAIRRLKFTAPSFLFNYTRV